MRVLGKQNKKGRGAWNACLGFQTFFETQTDLFDRVFHYATNFELRNSVFGKIHACFFVTNLVLCIIKIKHSLRKIPLDLNHL